MQVFADTFVPTDIGDLWFGSHLCPACAARALHAVVNLGSTQWLCRDCGRCWTPVHGHLERVDPWTCGGCATKNRRECIACLQRDIPVARYGDVLDSRGPERKTPGSRPLEDWHG